MMFPLENPQDALAVAFGFIFIFSLIIIATKFPSPTSFQITIFRVILALSAAGVAAVIPGFIRLEMEAVQGLALRAGGAIAVFALVYFFNPAERHPEPRHHLGTLPDTSSSLPDWALRKDVRALKEELNMLPLSHRLVLSAIAMSGRALRPADFLANPDMAFTRREVVYICRELEAKCFIETRDYTDKEYAISKAVSDTLGSAAKRFLSTLPGNEKLRPI